VLGHRPSMCILFEPSSPLFQSLPQSPPKMAATLGFDVTAVCALNLKLSCFSVESSLQWHLVRQFFLLPPPVLWIFHTWRVNHSHVWAKLQEQLCLSAGKHEEKHTIDTKSYNSRNVDSAKGWTVGIPKCVLYELL